MLHDREPVHKCHWPFILQNFCSAVDARLVVEEFGIRHLHLTACLHNVKWVCQSRGKTIISVDAAPFPTTESRMLSGNADLNLL